MSEDSRDGQAKAKTEQGGEGKPGGPKRGDDGKSSKDVKQGYDVKMGAYGVKVGGEADKKK